MERFNTADLFFEAANAHPDKRCIVHGNREITFAELKREVTATAAYFQSKGITKGDRVLVFVPMSVDLYRIVLALFHIGATAVFLDEWVSKKRLEICCEIAGCKAFIGNWKIRLFSLFSKELRKVPVQLGLSYQPIADFPLVVTQRGDTALITFTTGSTGTPKAAKRTHGFLEKQFKALIEVIDPQPGDVDMPVLPIVLLINLGAGVTSVITPFSPKKPHKLNVGQTMETIRKHKVTRIVASPYFVLRLVETKTEQDLPALQQVFTGGAPVFPADALRLTRAFPGAAIRIVYGSTEAEPISSIDARVLSLEKPVQAGGLNVGQPDKSAEVRIILISDEIIAPKSEKEFSDLQVQPGEIGEIIVAGEHVLQEYYNNPEALKRNKIGWNGQCWHRTGDSGFLDNGTLFLTGRCSELVYRDNTILSPFLYEYKLQQIDGIEAGTLMLLKEKATIIVQCNLSEKELDERIAEAGLFFEHLERIPQIPRDPRHYSKIDYGKLREILE